MSQSSVVRLNSLRSTGVVIVGVRSAGIGIAGVRNLPKPRSAATNFTHLQIKYLTAEHSSQVKVS